MFGFINCVDNVIWSLQRVCKHVFCKGVLTSEPLLIVENDKILEYYSDGLVSIQRGRRMIHDSTRPFCHSESPG